jgi:four helix bundle protein
MRNFRELEIWQLSFNMVEKIYQYTKALPDDEKFGLTSQMRRAAVSMPSNIAEGCGRNSDVELKRFLDITMGSAFELETQLLLVERLALVPQQKIDNIIDELHQVQKMTNAFIQTLKRRTKT